MTRIKICGITREQDLEFALRLKVDALGFVFYPESPRYVKPQLAGDLLQKIPPFVTSVGLFVNASEAMLVDTLKYAPVSLLQFHGDESPEQCHVLAEIAKKKFIRACRIKPDTTGHDLLEYESSYRKTSPWFQGLLLDTHVESYGGSGKVFDWSIIPKELAPRVVLSGGLTTHNVSGAVDAVRPWAVDVSSGVELSKGIKDPAKMQAFVEAVQQVDSQISR